MTQSDLETLLLNGDAAGLVTALTPLTEEQRRPLGKVAAAWLREWRKRKMQVMRDALARTHTFSSANPEYQKAELTEAAAQLAVLGLSGWSEAKAIPAFIYPEPRVAAERILTVLRARRPDWLDQWVAKELAARSTDWCLIRTLVREGLCSRPTDPRYILQMVGSHFGWRWDLKCSLADLLRQDPDLLQNEFWRMFELDLGERQLLTVEDISSNDTRAPSTAIRDLVCTGDISRTEVLSATLSAPLHNSNPLNATWFCRLHEKLTPSLDERDECQPAYRELLPSPHPPVVGFALDALKILASEGRLEVEPFAMHVTPVFAIDKKAQASTALQILKLSAKHNPGEALTIACAASHALAHPKSDIQAKALDLISSLVSSPSAAVADAIEPHVGTVAASLRPTAQSLLARLRSTTSTPAEPEIAATDDLAPLLAQARATPAPWHTLAGLDSCLSAIEHGADLRPITFDPMCVPHLDPANRLQPIDSLDQLIEQLSTAIEGLDDADQLELLIDAMCRFADLRATDDFRQRTAPLTKRIDDLLQQGGVWGSIHPFVAFAHAWLTRNSGAFGAERYTDAYMPASFIARRLASLNRRLLAGAAGPILACPTHKGGWVDPPQLVARLLQWQARAHAEGRPSIDAAPLTCFDKSDLVQALLRLAPDNRASALLEARALCGDIGIALRYALGSDEPGAGDADLLVAATRARHPSATCPLLTGNPRAANPDAATPASISWSPTTVGHYGPKSTIRLHIIPKVQPPIPEDQPTVALLHQGHRQWWGTCTRLDPHCTASIWPANLAGHFIQAAGTISARLHMPGSTFSPVGSYLDPLFNPDTPFTELAQLALSIALISKDPGTKGLALDAMIALVDDGRSTGHELGPILARISTQSGFLHLNRLAAALQELARISELHHYAAIASAISLLSSLTPPAPADLHHLLSFLHESLAATHQPLPASTHLILQSITTSAKGGKAVKLAKSLLAHHPTPNPAWLSVVHTRALTGRLARATRWQSLTP